MTAPASAGFRDYLELTKPRLSLLSVLTTLVGYFAARPVWDGMKFTLLLTGTSLAAGGVAATKAHKSSRSAGTYARRAVPPAPSVSEARL